MVMGADDYSVAYVSGRSEAEHDADAALIAAAPEMYEALEAAWPAKQVRDGALRPVLPPDRPLILPQDPLNDHDKGDHQDA